MQAVIMAGGKGTRLAALTKDEIPKPMVEVAGKPLLLWQVERLKDHGITDILMVIGHLGEKIQEFFGDGERFGVRIRYFVEETPLGTAGSFYYLKDMVEETFFMMSGDLFFDIDFGRMLAFHEKKKAAATLFVHPNGHPYDSDLLVLDEDDRVRKFDSKHNTRDYWYENCVNAGIFVFNRKICDRVPEPVKRNLENDVIQGMIQDGESVYGYRSPEYVKDVGTVDRIQQTLKDIERGFIAEKSLSRKQKCIFLDRDGTINQYRGLVYKEEDFELEPCAVQAVKRINQSAVWGSSSPTSRWWPGASAGSKMWKISTGSFPPFWGRRARSWTISCSAPITRTRDTRRKIRPTRSPVSAGSQRPAWWSRQQKNITLTFPPPGWWETPP